MSYTPPYIDDSGIHVNTYQDILDYFVNGSKDIFGQDIYLEEDSQDYELLSIIARAAYNSEQCTVSSYNSRSPQLTMSNDALDGIITINGLKRKPSSYSTATVILTGTPYTQIVGGVVQSIDGTRWNLPNEVIIGANGSVSVVATATTLGSITALPNEINQIVTPTYGWTSVTNNTAAFPGQPIETMEELKARQEQSVATPSQTPLEGVEAAIYNLLGVTDFHVYENDTSAQVGFQPPHSITAVVEGGSDTDIAEAIALKKTPGCYTQGDVVIPVIDKYGSQNNIRFYRPNYQTVYATFTIQPLTGYSSAIASAIQEAVIDYLQKLKIGNTLYLSQMWEAALSVSPDVKPYFSLKSVVMGLSSDSQTANDIEANFDDKFQSEIANITITVQS